MHAPPIDHNLLATLATLARLSIPSDRAGVVQDRLQRIVAAFAALRELQDPAPGDADPDPVDGASSPPAPLGLRPDVAGPVLQQEHVLANAPRRAGGAFLVPRVVDA